MSIGSPNRFNAIRLNCYPGMSVRKWYDDKPMHRKCTNILGVLKCLAEDMSNGIMVSIGSAEYLLNVCESLRAVRDLAKETHYEKKFWEATVGACKNLITDEHLCPAV